MKVNKILKIISSITLASILCYTLPVMAYTKEETVYSKLDADGNPYQTIVSNHIKNNDALTSIQDISDLLNIENTNGYETFERNGNTIVWNANGKDIYYQGESEKVLPISCNISYELNGKSISKEDILGKSGRVKITLKYINNEKHIININGQNETIYTPFLVIAGTVINNEVNNNITISSGKIIDDGSKTIAIGMAFPGMSESLKIDESLFELPNEISIELNTNDFELNTIASFITPKIIENREDLKNLDKLEEIYKKIYTLQSASEEILDGAEALKKGTEEYSKKKQEFNVAIAKVSNGMSNANKSYAEINSGISELNKSSKIFGNGAKKVSEGAKKIDENLDLLVNKLDEIEQGSAKLELGEQQMKQELKEFYSSINLQNTTETCKNLQDLIQQNENTIKTLKKMNETLESQLTPSNTIQLETNKKIITLLTANEKAQKETLTSLKSLNQLQIGIEKLTTAINSLQAGNKELTTGIQTIKKGATTIANKSKELKNGANSLYDGSKNLSSGTQKIEQGSIKMKQGLNTLDTSTTKLNIADSALTEGAETIKDGANSLYNGILKFNKQGVEPICNKINSNLSNFTSRLKKVEELSLKYSNYTMLKKGEKGTVKFVQIIDGINKESKQKQDDEEIILNKNEKNDEYIKE